MHKLKDFKDEINKCSKCGLCQAVCPIYKLTGNDCAVSRGKFVMLNGVLKNDLNIYIVFTSNDKTFTLLNKSPKTRALFMSSFSKNSIGKPL